MLSDTDIMLCRAAFCHKSGYDGAAPRSCSSSTHTTPCTSKPLNSHCLLMQL